MNFWCMQQHRCTLKHFAKLNKPKKKGQILYDSTSEVPKINKFIENTIEVTTRSWMMWERGIVLEEYRVSVWGDDKVLEMDGNADCITIWVYLMQLNCTF